MRNTNSLQDEIRLQHQKLDGRPFSKRLEYYWHYYKVHIIVTVLLACFFGSILHPIIHQKDTVLSIAYINAFPNVEDKVIVKDLETYLQLNTEKQQVLLDSTYYIDTNSTSPYAETYSQKFSANAMAGNFDVVLADTANFDFYGNQEFFQDLSTILSKEELAKYQDRLYYINLPNDDSNAEVPVGIKIDKAAKICKTSCYPNSDAYYGIVTGTKHIDAALSFLTYIEN